MEQPRSTRRTADSGRGRTLDLRPTAGQSESEVAPRVPTPRVQPVRPLARPSAIRPQQTHRPPARPAAPAPSPVPRPRQMRPVARPQETPQRQSATESRARTQAATQAPQVAATSQTGHTALWKTILQYVAGIVIIFAVAAAIVALYVKYYAN